MISVGIRELKSHLSQYFNLVKQGENILITEHNKVVAELKFLEHKPSDDSKIKEMLSECNLLSIGHDVQKIIELKKEIADCRSLDAIHVATAIYIKDQVGVSRISFYSFDKRVTAVARKFGLR